METKRLMKSCAKLGAEGQEKASWVKAPPVLKLPVKLTALTILEFNYHGSVILPKSSPANVRAEPRRPPCVSAAPASPPSAPARCYAAPRFYSGCSSAGRAASQASFNWGTSCSTARYTSPRSTPK